MQNFHKQRGALTGPVSRESAWWMSWSSAAVHFSTAVQLEGGVPLNAQWQGTKLQSYSRRLSLGTKDSGATGRASLPSVPHEHATDFLSPQFRDFSQLLSAVLSWGCPLCTNLLFFPEWQFYEERPPLSWPNLDLTPRHNVLPVHTSLEVLVFSTLTYGFGGWHHLAYGIQGVGFRYSCQNWFLDPGCRVTPCDRQQGEDLRRCFPLHSEGYCVLSCGPHLQLPTVLM